MKRAFLPASVVLASLTVGCGGTVGSLLATVPPPVEFAAQRPGGLAELPAAGTWHGTLMAERVTYRYQPLPDSTSGEWVLVRSVPIQGSGPAEAIIGVDGSIALRRTGETTALFSGSLFVSSDANAANPTTANLTSADGTTVKYPYTLHNGEPQTLTVMPHGPLLSSSKQIVTLDRYWFELAPG